MFWVQILAQRPDSLAGFELTTGVLPKASLLGSYTDWRVITSILKDCRFFVIRVNTLLRLADYEVEGTMIL